MEQTVKCPICGKPYKVYSHTVADQSACSRCVEKAEKKIQGSCDYQKREMQQHYFRIN